MHHVQIVKPYLSHRIYVTFLKPSVPSMFPSFEMRFCQLETIVWHCKPWFSQCYSGRKITASFIDRYKYTWEAGRDRKTIAHRKREHNPFLVLYDVKQVQKYRNGGQLWVVNVFSYTIHAQTGCWPTRSPLTLSIFFPLLLWRFLSSQLFCVHYTKLNKANIFDLLTLDFKNFPT
jgi:hypothetical protein